MYAGAALPSAESDANWNLGLQLSDSVRDVFSAGIADPLGPHLSATYPQLFCAGPQPLRSDPLPFLGEPDWLQVRRRVSGPSARQEPRQSHDLILNTSMPGGPRALLATNLSLGSPYSPL